MTSDKENTAKHPDEAAAENDVKAQYLELLGVFARDLPDGTKSQITAELRGYARGLARGKSDAYQKAARTAALTISRKLMQSDDDIPF